MVFSMDFPITNCLPFFFLTDNFFYLIILSHTLGRGPSKLLIKKFKCHQRLLERTKVYYCFNSKGDNFNVNQLKTLPKTSHTSETKYLAVSFLGNRRPFK